MKVLGKGKENLFNLLILSLSIIYSKFNLPFGRIFFCKKYYSKINSLIINMSFWSAQKNALLLDLRCSESCHWWDPATREAGSQNSFFVCSLCQTSSGWQVLWIASSLTLLAMTCQSASWIIVPLGQVAHFTSVVIRNVLATSGWVRIRSHGALHKIRYLQLVFSHESCVPLEHLPFLSAFR